MREAPPPATSSAAAKHTREMREDVGGHGGGGGIGRAPAATAPAAAAALAAPSAAVNNVSLRRRRAATAAAVFSAVFYAVTAIAMNFLNRWAVVFYPQPLIVLSLQMLAAAAIVLPLQRAGRVRLARPLSLARARELSGISLLYTANTAFALFGLKTLSIPAYSTLKRLTPAVVLAAKAAMRGAMPQRGVSAAVALLVGGSMVAGAGDLAFDALGYAFALLSCTSQAAYLLLVEWSGRGSGAGGGGGGGGGKAAAAAAAGGGKGGGGGGAGLLPVSDGGGDSHRHDDDDDDGARATSNDNSTGGRATTGELLLYNALTSLPLLALLALLDGELRTAPREMAAAAARHGAARVLLSVGGCALVGVALNYSLFLCTAHNSALTTTVVGGVKGVAVVLLGAAFDHAARFTFLGACGIALNCAGGVLYTAVKYKRVAAGGRAPRDGGIGGFAGDGAPPSGTQQQQQQQQQQQAAAAGPPGGLSAQYAAPLLMLRRSALASASAEPLMAVAAAAAALGGAGGLPPAVGARAALADAESPSHLQNHNHFAHHRHPHAGGETTALLAPAGGGGAGAGAAAKGAAAPSPGAPP